MRFNTLEVNYGTFGFIRFRQRRFIEKTVKQLEAIPSQGVKCPGKITCVVLGHVKRPVS